MKRLLGVLMFLMVTVGVLAGAAAATFTYKTPGASDTSEVVSLVYPQKVPEDASVTTDSIADGSVTQDKVATGFNLLSDAEKLIALADTRIEASGSLTVRESMATIDAFGAGAIATLSTPLEIPTFMLGILVTMDTNGNCAVYQLDGGTTANLLAGDNTTNNPSTGTVQQIVATGGGNFQLKRIAAAAGYAIKWIGLEH